MQLPGIEVGVTRQPILMIPNPNPPAATMAHTSQQQKPVTNLDQLATQGQEELELFWDEVHLGF